MRKIVTYFSILTFLVAVISLFFTNEAAAQIGAPAAQPGGYGGQQQNQIGDVVGPMVPGQATGATGAAISLFTAPNIAGFAGSIFLGGGNDALTSLFASLAGSISDLPPLLQSLLMSAVLNLDDLDEGSLAKLLANFTALQNAYNVVSDVGCFTGSLNTVYAQNALIASVDVKELATANPIEVFAETVVKLCSGGAEEILNPTDEGEPDEGEPDGGGDSTTSKHFDPSVLDPGNEYKSTDPGPCDSSLVNYLNNVSPEYFGDRFSELPYYVRQAAIELDVDPSDLMAVMMVESGGLPYRDNGVGYKGLIQFGDAAAADLGTTNDAIAALSVKDQMPYVIEYLRQHGVKPGMNSLQIYASIHAGQASGSVTKRDCRNGLRTVDIHDSKVTPFKQSFASSFDWNNLECIAKTEGKYKVLPAQKPPPSWSPTC